MALLRHPPASRRSGKACASLATSREKTLPSSTDMRRESRSAPELAAELVRLKVDIIVAAGPTRRPVLPRMRPRRFPSSWRTMVILLGTDSSQALRGPAGISPGLQPLHRELSGKRLELLEGDVPKLSVSRSLRSGQCRAMRKVLKRLQLAAAALKLTASIWWRIRGPRQI